MNMSEGQVVADKPVTLESLIGQMDLLNSRVFDVNEQLDDIANRIYGGSALEGKSDGNKPNPTINDQLNYLQDQLATLELRVARIRGD